MSSRNAEQEGPFARDMIEIRCPDVAKELTPSEVA
jgi:hypothetical protein